MLVINEKLLPEMDQHIFVLRFNVENSRLRDFSRAITETLRSHC